MKLTYTNSVEDWAAAQAHYLETLPGFRENIAFWRWTFALALGTVAVSATPDWSAWARAFLGLSLALVLYVWYPRYVINGYRTRGQMQMNVKESLPFMTCERVVELTENGLRIESLIGSQLVKWAVVKAVDDTPAHVFIRFRFGLGLPIPKVSMTPAEKDLLVEGIRARIATG